MRAYMRAKTVDGVIDESIARRVGLTGARDRGHVPDHGDRQLRGSLRHPDRAPRARRGRLRSARLVRLLVRQRLLGRHDRDQPVRRAASAPRPRWRSCDDDEPSRRCPRCSAIRPPSCRRRSPRSRGASTRRRCSRPRCGSQLDAAARRARDRRSLRPAGALRAAVRPHALAVAAPVRACARREPRPRPGDDRPQEPVRAERPRDRRRRAAGFRAAVPRIPVDAAAPRRRASCSASRRISFAHSPSGCASAVRPTRRCSARSSRSPRRSPRARTFRRCWRSPIRMPTTSPRSMPPGRTSRSTSGPDAANSCKDSLIARIRAGRRPAPGSPSGQPRPILPRS